MLAEQDNANSVLADKLKRSQQTIAAVQSEMERRLASLNEERISVEESLTCQMRSAIEEKQHLEKRLQEHSDEVN